MSLLVLFATVDPNPLDLQAYSVKLSLTTRPDVPPFRRSWLIRGSNTTTDVLRRAEDDHLSVATMTVRRTFRITCESSSNCSVRNLFDFSAHTQQVESESTAKRRHLETPTEKTTAQKQNASFSQPTYTDDLLLTQHIDMSQSNSVRNSAVFFL